MGSDWMSDVMSSYALALISGNRPRKISVPDCAKALGAPILLLIYKVHSLGSLPLLQSITPQHDSRTIISPTQRSSLADELNWW